jgi:acetyl-CoA carboxylase carboxyl transferase subunit alpha
MTLQKLTLQKLIPQKLIPQRDPTIPMFTFLEFERPIAELESKIEELRHLTNQDGINIAEEVAKLQVKVDKLLKQTYAKLLPVQKVQVARHPNRPHLTDYLAALITDFTPLAGDRAFAEDRAIIGGIGRFRGHSVMVIGQEKGNDTESRLRHNFGMAKPEGYRKAQRLMYLAERFKLPVLTLVDTAGAYPGVGAEQRGQAEAIARCIETCLRIRVPLIAAVIGEGGSGGAIALAAADRVLMLEHAIYSVISPEGCASILWRDGGLAGEAATALRLTAQDLKELGVIDSIVSEPVGGAHRNPQAAITALGDALEQGLEELRHEDGLGLRIRRREKFLRMSIEGIGRKEKTVGVLGGGEETAPLKITG